MPKCEWSERRPSRPASCAATSAKRRARPRAVSAAAAGVETATAESPNTGVRLQVARCHDGARVGQRRIAGYREPRSASDRAAKTQGRVAAPHVPDGLFQMLIRGACSSRNIVTLSLAEDRLELVVGEDLASCSSHSADLCFLIYSHTLLTTTVRGSGSLADDGSEFLRRRQRLRKGARRRWLGLDAVFFGAAFGLASLAALAAGFLVASFIRLSRSIGRAGSCACGRAPAGGPRRNPRARFRQAASRLRNLGPRPPKSAVTERFLLSSSKPLPPLRISHGCVRVPAISDRKLSASKNWCVVPTTATRNVVRVPAQWCRSMRSRKMWAG